MIAIIDYKAGNLASVSNALQRLGASYEITSKTEDLDRASAVIFPGVGHAASAMQDLARNGLDRWLRETTRPVLGICLGMQLFYESSSEGGTRALGIVPGTLNRFSPDAGKVPHMGWNAVTPVGNHPLFNGIATGTHFYHVHSYYAPVSAHTIASSRYTDEFTAAVAWRNFYGVQFHPEKSGMPGEKLLANFLTMVGKQ